MGTLKRLFYSALLAGSLAYSPQAAGEDLPAVEGRFAWAPRYSLLNLKESKTVPVHPADAGFISGSTQVKAGNGMEAFVLRPGIEWGKSYGNIRPKIGVDAEITLDQYLINDKDGPTMSDFRQQTGDTRSAENGSFAMDQFDRDFLGIYPFVGLDVKVGDGVLSLEAGLPAYQTGTRRWGHHRNDKFEEIGSEKFALKGWRARVAWGGAPDAKEYFSPSRLGIEFMVDKVTFEDGDMTSFTLGLFTKF